MAMPDNGNTVVPQSGRIVVLGSRGVIGRSLMTVLGEDGELAPRLFGISSADIDLLSDSAADDLSQALRPDDAVIVLSALAPDKGRDTATLLRNIRMAEAVCQALRTVAPSHVVYMSSDAVYPFDSGVVSEASPAAPTDLYGVMHRTREIMFGSLGLDAPLAVLRCTLVLSPHDTHNSYGPNRFRQQALAEGRIVLGGRGEEMRDHVAVGDVSRLVAEVVRRRFDGTLNLASGTSHSFLEVANMVAHNMARRPEIETTARTMPVTHRHFDVTHLRRTFPTFRFTPLAEAIAKLHRSEGLAA